MMDLASPEGDSLRQITAAADKAQVLAERIAAAEEVVKVLKREYTAVLEVELPDLMSEVGFSYLRLTDGTPVEVLPFHYGSITVKNKEKAHAWLEAAGHGGLIKRTLNVTFDRGAAGFEDLQQHVRSTGLRAEAKETINTNTFNAWLRQQKEAGEYVPPDLFSVYSGLRAKIG